MPTTNKKTKEQNWKISVLLRNFLKSEGKDSHFSIVELWGDSNSFLYLVANLNITKQTPNR